MTVKPQLHHVDVLILGAGAVGLTAALSIPENLSVAVLTKDPSGGSTRWAQGGVAAVIDDQDSVHQTVVEHVVSNAREAIDWLIGQGVTFTKTEGAFHLTREGGHSHRRILHAADATEWAIQDALDRRTRSQKHQFLS